MVHSPVSTPTETPSSGRVRNSRPISAPAASILSGAPPWERMISSQAASTSASVTVWLISEADMARNQGEAASRMVTRLAMPRDAARTMNLCASSTAAAPSRGLTSHGTPALTPSARTAGQPGGKIENQRPSRTVMKSYCSALTASTGGAAAANAPWAK